MTEDRRIADALLELADHNIARFLNVDIPDPVKARVTAAWRVVEDWSATVEGERAYRQARAWKMGPT